MSNEHVFENEEQFVISHELLVVLQWLLKYEETELSRIITQAYVKGFEETLKNHPLMDQIQESSDIEHSVVHFLNYLEHHVQNMTSQEHSKKIIHKNVIDALDHIDPKSFDYETIKSTVLATADKIKPKNPHDARSVFLKELLKQWNPKKIKTQKSMLH